MFLERLSTNCHLLEINNVKLIINAGISEEEYHKISNFIGECDGLLLTSAESEYSLSAHLFNIPIYCTVPIQIFLQLECNTFKYVQPFFIKNIRIIAHNTGNSLGNSAYEIEDLLIAFSYNIRKELYLDNLDLNILKNKILLTNSKYVKIKKTSLKKRNSEILKLIDKKTVFVCDFSRLLELACIVGYGHVLMKDSKEFYSKISSMLEWGGSRSVDILSNIKFNKLEDSNLYLIPSNSIYLGKILQNNYNFVFFCDIPNKIPVNDISYEVLKENFYEENESSFETEEFIKINNNFNLKNRKIFNNDYGFKFNYKIIKKRESFENLIYEKTFEKVNFKYFLNNFKYKKNELLNNGISCLEDFLISLEVLNPIKIILINDENSNYLYNLLKLKNFNTEILYKKIYLNFIKYKIIEFKPNLNYFTNFDNYKIKLINSNKNLMIGNFNIENLMKILIEKNLKLEITDNFINVENKLTILYNKELIIESYDINLLFMVREFIYNSIKIV